MSTDAIQKIRWYLSTRESPLRRSRQGRQVGYYIKVLSAERVSRFVGRSEHPLQVGQPKIVDVLVVDVEPGPMATDPVEARDFYIYESAASVRVANRLEKRQGIRHMLEHMTKDDAACLEPKTRREVFATDIRVFSFVRRIESG